VREGGQHWAWVATERARAGAVRSAYANVHVVYTSRQRRKKCMRVRFAFGLRGDGMLQVWRITAAGGRAPLRSTSTKWAESIHPPGVRHGQLPDGLKAMLATKTNKCIEARAFFEQLDAAGGAPECVDDVLAAACGANWADEVDTDLDSGPMLLKLWQAIVAVTLTRVVASGTAGGPCAPPSRAHVDAASCEHDQMTELAESEEEEPDGPALPRARRPAAAPSTSGSAAAPVPAPTAFSAAAGPVACPDASAAGLAGTPAASTAAPPVATSPHSPLRPPSHHGADVPQCAARTLACLCVTA
jgi:hypothetical protein